MKDDLFQGIDHDGVTYDRERDQVRLNSQQAKVYALMRDSCWRTLQEISRLTGEPETSVSARLRDLRKPKFGGHTVNRKYIERGLWRYQLIVRPTA